jgi:hypothetical protein
MKLKHLELHLKLYGPINFFLHKTWFRWLVKSAAKRCKDFQRLTCMTEHKYEILSFALENCSSGKAPCWWLNILYTGAFPFPEQHFSREEFHFDQLLLQCRSRQIVPTIMHSGHNFDFIDYIGMFKDYAVVKKLYISLSKDVKTRPTRK